MVIRNRDSVVVLNEQNKGIAFQSSWLSNIDDFLSEVQAVANKFNSQHIVMLSVTPSYYENYLPIYFYLQFIGKKSPEILEDDSEAEKLMKFYFDNPQCKLDDMQIIKSN